MYMYFGKYVETNEEEKGSMRAYPVFMITTFLQKKICRPRSLFYRVSSFFFTVILLTLTEKCFYACSCGKNKKNFSLLFSETTKKKPLYINIFILIY